MAEYKELFALIASLLSIYAHIPYIQAMYRGTAKPHVFTWFLWALMTFIAFAGQLAAGGGVGSVVSGVTALLSLIVAVLALRMGEKSITRSDWVAFIIALSAIPVWLATGDPLWSVIIVTVIDVVAYWPMLRKSWLKPHEEPALMYGLGMIRHTLTMLAMANTTLTTLVFPAALFFMNVGTFAMLMYRRKALAVG
ncbi:MAG: hypothetical protein AB7G06_09945 [Bdellovibrionales bacterium]